MKCAGDNSAVETSIMELESETRQLSDSFMDIDEDHTDTISRHLGWSMQCTRTNDGTCLMSALARALDIKPYEAWTTNLTILLSMAEYWKPPEAQSPEDEAELQQRGVARVRSVGRGVARVRGSGSGRGRGRGGGRGS